MRTPTEHVKTLQRRVDFLKSRGHKNSYDAAELGSLEWALVNLSLQRQPLTDEQIAVACGWMPEKGCKPLPNELKIARAIEAAHGIKGEA